MNIQTITPSLREFSVFEDLSDEQLEFISGCAANVRFKKGTFLLHAGKAATHFFIIRDGLVALEMEAANKIVTLQTVSDGHTVGWSWLVPPYTWHYDARAATDVAAISFDAVCVREKCDRDPAFGYQIFKRFSRVMVERLVATRMQLADMYH